MKEKNPRCASCLYYSPIEGERRGFCMITLDKVSCNFSVCSCCILREKVKELYNSVK